MNERKVVAVAAGLGVPSSSRLLADAITAAVSKKLLDEGVVSSVLTYELRDYAVDIAHNMTNGFASPRLAEVIAAVGEADLLIAVTPVFTAGLSGLFKSFFDVIDNKMLTGKPVIMGATGGTSRHSMVLDYAMRPMFAYLKADILPTSIFAGPDDWGVGEGSSLSDRVERVASEASHKLRGAVLAKIDIKQGSDGSLPFEELLANITRK